ncbi:MAG: permease of phosphate ABC transporter [Aristaeellaceae bacterium]
MKLFDIANRYCRESTWKTLAVLKFCLLSLGIVIGVLLPQSCKVPVLIIFGIIFVVTYVPLMAKLFRLWKS